MGNLHAPSRLHEQGTLMVYGDGPGAPVVALRFSEVESVEAVR